MERAEKETLVAELKERMERAPALYLTDFHGLNVQAMTKLRRSLRASGAEYVVVKNRLAQKAFESLPGMPDVSGKLEGPTGVVFGYEDVVATAKALSDFAKEHEQRPAVKVGVMDRKIIDATQVARLASLPPREQLLAELAGAMQAPIAQLAWALEAKVQEMAGLLEALKNEREQAG
ncbi:MAG: 50S ribosomal protein L10 [Gemmatimonadetes bacterium]|nr:50S ribosomal protein L10 [Gemmatimonadota bacterium]